MKYYPFIVIFRISMLMLVFVHVSFSQIKKEDIERSIAIQDLRHPYLFFTDAEKPAILERIASDPECRMIMKRLTAEGNRYVNMPFTKKRILQPVHPRFDTENEAAQYLSDVSNGALTLSFLYQMTGDLRYLPRAVEFADAICDAPEWVQRAHMFDIIYPRVWPWNVPDDQVVFSYDLITARVSRTLSTVYDWLYPALTKPQRDKIRGAILERAIIPVRGNYEFFWWSAAYRCNWSAICYSGLGISALAVMKEHPQLIDVVTEASNRIPLSFDQIGDEGGWQEGRGYYNYMIHSTAYFMDALKRMTSKKIDLFTHPKIKANAFDFDLYAMTTHFGDSEPHNGGPTFAVNKYVAETGSSTSAFYRDTFLGAGNDIFDILWPRSTVRAVEPVQSSRFFKNINWAVLRSSFLDPSSVTVACKAGYNNDPHHGHLDCGQFTVTWKNTPFIRDLGRMKYDEFYFNNERFDYLHASSAGHNVISVNGEQQMIAKRKNEPWKENVGGQILVYRTDAKRDYVLMDPSGAYPGKELKKWRRNIILEKPVITLVLDEITSVPGARILSRLFPGVGDMKNGGSRSEETAAVPVSGSDVHSRLISEGIRIKDDIILMTDRGGNTMAVIPVVLNNECTIIEDSAVEMVVMKNAEPEWFRYIDIVTTAKEKSTVIAAVILPVKNDDEAQQIARSVTITSGGSNSVIVRLSNNKEPLQWEFERTTEGLLLRKN